MQEKELLPHLFRTEYRKIIAVLARYYGLEQLSIAEDIASETFLTAAETWGIKGLPENPVAWLYTVAKNKSRDQLRRMAVFQEKLSFLGKEKTEAGEIYLLYICFDLAEICVRRKIESQA